MPQRSGLESLPLKNRSSLSQSFCAQILCGLLIAVATLGLAACNNNDYYKFPQFTFANRPIPPSKLANRVMASVTVNGTQGSLQILDALRDIRSNVQNTIPSFSISGYGAGFPSMIFNFPEQVLGYVYSNSDGSLTKIDYGKEASAGSAGTFPTSTGIAIPPSFNHIYAAEAGSGILGVLDQTTGKSYGLNLPNVYQVAVNQGDTVVLAMVRNSNTLYRLIKLNANQAAPSGSVDCQPVSLPVYCVVPVPDSPTKPSLDRPTGVYFSLDGSLAYVLNCGPECGGQTAGITVLQQGSLTIDVNTPPYPNAVTSSVAIPGGVTTSLSDGTTLYLAGQQLQPDGLWAGRLTLLNMSTMTPGAPISISDGHHTKMLFADDNTLWIGSQFCATGERAKLGQNYNCLTSYNLGTGAASIVPAVNPQDPNSSVPFPNANQNQWYLGDLTGLCWVEGLHKVYTAYGGQVHAFNTTDLSEINNQFIIIQGTALDVAYMDASTNTTN